MPGFYVQRALKVLCELYTSLFVGLFYLHDKALKTYQETLVNNNNKQQQITQTGWTDLDCDSLDLW